MGKRQINIKSQISELIKTIRKKTKENENFYIRRFCRATERSLNTTQLQNLPTSFHTGDTMAILTAKTTCRLAFGCYPLCTVCRKENEKKIIKKKKVCESDTYKIYKHL